ncbi:phosphate ABC transporter substrate-binding protein PstS [Candidatus Marinamargulisbacteria bacterium SCGC AAA071-K20]|nr:phosphate ABC transporter substrate-binding protein PstS [Candidatus Marinamargulisbacteria bacterium SCGC AAA071-K20]
MINKKFKKILKNGTVLSLLMLSLVGCGKSDKVTELQGAGATFPYPLYSKMFDAYHKEFGPKINYQSIGSGGGIRQLKNKTVDFGASDAFMSNKALKESGNNILHIPICLGAVAILYNLPGVSQLKLTPDVLAGIFLGNISKWNDSSIQQINPGVKLPDLRIVSVHRSDGSGTTFIFTDYLSKISKPWLDKVGRGKSINWPDGLGGKGNAGVAGIVQQTPGAIGYIGHIYAVQNKMAVASLRNKSGKYIEPSLEAVAKAANTTIPNDTRASITDTSAKYGYPISGFTWILSYKEQNFNSRSIKQAQETKKLLEWMIGDGQRFAEPLLYAPLTPSVVKKAQKIIESITYSGKAL